MAKYPIIKITVIFILGILFQSHMLLKDNFYFTPLIILFIIIIPLSIFKIYYPTTLLMKIILGTFIFLVGAYYYSFNFTHVRYPFDTPKIKNAKIACEITNLELATSKKLSLEVTLDENNDSLILNKRNNKYLLNVWEDSLKNAQQIYNQIKIGNSISLIGNISRAKNKRNPGEFDYEKYLNGKGIAGVINCYKPEGIQIVDKDYLFMQNMIFSIRKSINEIIKMYHSHNSAALLKGILLADRKDLDYDIRTSFVNSGVIHVLAVSGLHVGFITGIFFLLFGRFDIRLKYSLTILGILFFLIITGGQSSVFRASTMAIVFLVTKLTGRGTNAFNSLSIAALVLLIIDPNDLFNPGFQLSFSAVLSILIIHPILSGKIKKLRVNNFIKNLLIFISVSLAAQLGTLPFTLLYFQKLSIISIFANLFVIPLIGIIVALGIITLIFSIISPAAAIFASANIILIEAMFYFVNFTSNLSFSFLPIYNFSSLDGVWFYLLLISFTYSLIRFKNKILFLSTILIIIVTFQYYISLDDNELLPKNNLSVVAIDVGQGDAILVKFPNNKISLIDAGNCTEYFDNGERVIYPLIQKLGIDTINSAFISHLDSDHFAGIISLVEKGIIDTIYKPYDPTYLKDKIFEEFVTANNIPIKYFSTKSFEIGGAKVYLLNDTNSVEYQSFDSNNKSGIIKICYGKNSFLFVGDAELEAEEYLVNLYKEFLNADVLKIGHHGSSSSSCDEFINCVKPKIGIISAGVMNKFKHPSKKTIVRFEKKNVKLLRTDYEGAIILTSNGNSISKIDWRK